ncbi:uncharacterized protein DSM5745_09792 [Aspergillus mulundensis]|uniref:Uncharacterized protein n=1 Tax=Aspergillus mulundensis TaxID=1810919 RepID=A0A3D8QRT0_9EURO|nr:hypothetical protein DSM5745_09792 [Aspergillus mulundensis]RDW64381.1 hypothetical protein DSM5745_09792 [Aspergillus mulundensis]
MALLLARVLILTTLFLQGLAISTELSRPQDTTVLDSSTTSFPSITTSLISTPTAVASTPIATATHHHWSYIPRPLPSRKPCRPRSSSAIPSSLATPSPSNAIPSSSSVRTPSAVPSSSPVRISPVAVTPIPSSRPIHTPSTSPQPHWTYISRPLPHRSCSLGASSSAAIPSSQPVRTTPVAPTPTATGTPSIGSTGAPHQGTTTPSASTGLALTTSTVLTTRTATITACPTTIPDCPASARTTSVTTETVLVSTTVCPVTEASSTTQPLPTSVASSDGSDKDVELSTSTVFTTRTATITACPSSVTDCPARSRTTSLTTETILAYTTVCPVAEAEATGGHGVTTTQHSPVSTATGAISSSELTTSTMLSTQIITITACPASVTDCPARSKTAHLATETFVIGTTVYPITEQPQPTGPSDNLPAFTTSTVLSTRVATVTACAAKDSNCNADSSQGTYIMTETLVIATSVLPVPSIQTQGPATAIDTKTITVDSCSSDGTCTGYVSIITMSKSESSQAPAATASVHMPSTNSGSAAGSSYVPQAAITSAPVIPQSSRPSGLSTSAIPSNSGSGFGSTTGAAPGALFTGAASASIDVHLTMLKIVGAVVMVLLTVFL